MAESKETDNSYKSILKGTSFFGGMQVFLILINLIRGKLVAMLLGPEGMGIANLFNTSSATVQRFASLGLNLAIVREVVATKTDTSLLQRMREVVMRVVMLTALFGCLICVAFSVQLSRFSFGTDSYSWQFVMLGASVALTIAGNGKMSILQGLHEVKALSVSSIIGAITGLVISVPMYYIWGKAAIVPAIVLYSLSTYVTYSIYLRKKLRRDRSPIRWREHFPLIKRLISLGVILMANELIFTLCSYLTSVFIRSCEELDSLGLYQAAHSITSQYMGVIFSAMSLDYFPRLTETARDNDRMTEVVNRQSMLVALVATPLSVLLIVFAPLVIRILLSEEFESVVGLLRLFSIGVLLQAYSFSMGYISFAKGNKRLFFILEGVYCNLQTLLLSCGGYYLWGLNGLGYGMILDFTLCIIVYYVVNHVMYGYRFSRQVLLHFIAGTAVVAVALFAASTEANEIWSIVMLGAVSILTVCYSLLRLKKLLKSKVVDKKNLRVANPQAIKVIKTLRKIKK
ncbi:MAG: oligosaccharide flippase family protein [Muribaculum sp.]|nr:oligosaccharide flippase family protein [Muribaculum sp.]